MNKKPFFPSFALFYLALFFCGAVRIYLKLAGIIDPITGFTNGGGWLPYALGGVMAAATVLFFLFYLLRRSDHDYPVLHLGRGLGVLMVIVGIGIGLYMFEALRILSFGNLNPGLQLGKVALIVTTIFGEISAVAFIVVGLRGVIGRRGMHGGLLPLTAGIWQLVALVSKFNAYSTLVTVSDNLLTVLFMLFSAVFLVGHARTLSGLARKEDGRNYAIPTGLCTALCGFVLVIPNWASMIARQTLAVPAPNLGGFESIFIFALSVYALAFVHSLARSIKSV